MAGGFEGYWVHGDTGKGHPVNDHALAVMHEPERYGMTHVDVHHITGGKPINQYDTAPESARGQLIKAAADRGWVRVRAMRGSYMMQLSGGAASRASKTMGFLRKNGVHPNSEMRLHDFASGYHQKFEGMSGVKAAIGRGEVPELHSHTAVGKEARATLGGKAKVAHGIPLHVDDTQARALLRQHLGARAGIPDRDMEERTKRALAESCRRLGSGRK